MRLLNKTHRRLMHGVRGADKRPARCAAARTGSAEAAPETPRTCRRRRTRSARCLSAFEKYLHADDALPPLVRAGLLHVQFETIHPYLDGNGRIGRLLVTLLLEHWKLLTKPLLYLSLFFKRHRDEYYRRLDAVRVDGDWEGWLDFFLDGVATIADEAVASARELFALVAADRARVLAHEGMSIVALRLFELLAAAPDRDRRVRHEARRDDQADGRPRDRAARARRVSSSRRRARSAIGPSCTRRTWIVLRVGTELADGQLASSAGK